MHRQIFIAAVFIAFLMLAFASCKIHQDTAKHQLFKKATVRRSTSSDTIAVIKQK